MKYQSSYTWSYHIISKRQINFYHGLLTNIELDEVKENVTFAASVLKEQDGSVTLELSEDGHLQQTIAELSLFLKDVEADFIATPLAYISPMSFKESLLHEWYFSLMGGLALILLSDPLIKDSCSRKWEYYDPHHYSLHLDPFMITVQSGTVKIVEPIKTQNYSLRKYIEQSAANILSGMFTRLIQAYPGYEGMAILTYIEEKSQLSAETITSEIERRLGKELTYEWQQNT